MTINCKHCGGRSRVVETRQHVQKRRGAHELHNVIRLRQCLGCRWRWKTMEKTYVEKGKKAAPPSPGRAVPGVRLGEPGAPGEQGRAGPVGQGQA